MSTPHLFPRRDQDDRTPPPQPAEAVDRPGVPEPVALPRDADLISPSGDEPRQSKTTTRSKLAEGMRGIKLAIRAESGYFAHAYRGLLIAISAAILGVSATGWCFLIVSAALVLVAETFRCAIVAVLDIVAEPGDPRVRVAREIAAGGLLFAAVTSACLTMTVLFAKLGEMLGW